MRKQLLLCLFLVLFAGGCRYDEPPPESGACYIIVASKNTADRQIADQMANALVQKGYPAGVYRTSNGYLAVALGGYSLAEAKDVKANAQKKGYIAPDSWIAGRPGLQEQLSGTSANSAGQVVYLVVRRTSDKTSAVEQAMTIKKSGYPGAVYRTSADDYVVVLDKVAASNARRRIDEALRDQVVYGNIRRDDGASFTERVYPSPGETQIGTRAAQADYYVVTASTTSLPGATAAARKLVSQGYDSEVYWTEDNIYVVTIGPYDAARAENIRKLGIERESIPRAAYLTAKQSFWDKKFPDPTAMAEETREKEYFVEIRRVTDRAEALALAGRLAGKGYSAAVYKHSGGAFSVTIAYAPYAQARRLQQQAIAAGDADNRSRLVKLTEYTRKIYPREAY